MKQRNNRPLLVCVTGDICSGKSHVMSYFSNNGLTTHSADEIIHEIYQREETISFVQDTFGLESITDSKVNRAKLRTIVFKDKNKLAILNKYFHPIVLNEMQALIQDYKTSTEKVVLFEIPLLFESNLQNAFDYTILIIANKDVKIKRIMKRDLCTRFIASAIIENQMSQELKIKKADIIIDNSDDIFFFNTQLKILGQLLPHLMHRSNISDLTTKGEKQ
jgi:dephospho-CoA kinase